MKLVPAGSGQELRGTDGTVPGTFPARWQDLLARFQEERP